MKIADSSIQFFSERTALEKHQKQESLTVWGPGEERSTATSENDQGQKIDVQKQIASMQESVKVSLSEQAVRSRSVKAVAEPGSEEKELMTDLNIRILKAMIERLTGKRIKVHSPDAVQTQKIEQGDSTAQEIPKGGNGAEAEPGSEGGLIYDSYESHYEYESTSFDASGKIMTEDGQEIDFSVALNMSREFFQKKKFQSVQAMP